MKQNKILTQNTWPVYQRASHKLIQPVPMTEFWASGYGDQEKERDNAEELVKFSTSKEYYAKTDMAWKRVYLLGDPPNAGKSTMIIAIANLRCIWSWVDYSAGQYRA